MNKIHLKYNSLLLKGTFSPKKLNLLLVFQVNCPGCFLYALPILNKLREEPMFKEIPFLALSTAFEDFDKNTIENTKSLIEGGELTGETKKELAKYGYDKLPYPLNFPIAMDAVVSNKDEINELVLDMCNTNPNYKIWPDWEQEAMQQKIHAHLNQLERVSYTFTANSLPGTPTFVIFDENYFIKEKWFGHKPLEKIKESISQWI